MVGPIGTAGSQFLLSVLLMHEMDQAAFGRFSFLLILTQLSWGIWSALFCAPLSSILARGEPEEQRRAEHQLFSANLIGAGAVALLFVGICRAMQVEWITAFIFAGYAGLALLRWFGRAHAYATGHQLSVTRSDSIYALAVLASPFAVRFSPVDPLLTTSAMLLIAVLAGMVTLRPRSFRNGVRAFTPDAARRYGAIWHSHGKWALLGVATTEATANGHAYLVTLLCGPAQFAPIAASALLIRPLTIGTNALAEYERPRLARIIGDDDLGRARNGVRFFRLMLGAVWAATALTAAALMAFAPRLIFPPRYDTGFLATAGVLWMIVGIARLLRTPDNVLLQAAGAFRPLAMASAVSAGVSLVAAGALILLSGPLWSIAGIFAGEMVFAAMTLRQSRRWLSVRADELHRRDTALALSRTEAPA